MKYTCAFCHSECVSLRAHWERCKPYKRFMAGSVYKPAARRQCVTPGCTNLRAHRSARKCVQCRERELAYQRNHSGPNGWRTK